ncbi:MAG: twin transmembrane helix small protein [Chromatiales bacterium]|nr:twin transmembrane helix small protein [Chromatiales bacterium]
MFYKILILLLFLAITVSLFSGLYFMLRDQGRTHRTVNSLIVRVGIATLLILILLYGFYSGQISMDAPWLETTLEDIDEQK